jgi:membrane-bound metal-dependent hydrolase YbcI (DUF457 family)
MLWPAHIGASYLASLAAIGLARGAGSDLRPRGVMAYGIAAGLAPDVDALPSILASGLPAFGSGFGGHRLSAFHSPVFAAVLCVLPLLLPVQNRKAWSLAGLIGVLSHLVLDSVTIGPGVRWLYPFSRELYGIDLFSRWYPADGRDTWMLEYLASPLFLIEIAIVVAAGAVWRRRRNVRSARS